MHRLFSVKCQVGAIPITVPRLLIAMASLVVSLGHTGFSSCSSWALEHRLNSCGAGAQFFRGMWDPPALGVEPVSPVLRRIPYH